MVLNAYTIPEIHPGCLGRHGIYPEEDETIIDIAERIFKWSSDEAIIDQELGRRIDLAFANWQETLNL
jgi:hypothetical protein